MLRTIQLALCALGLASLSTSCVVALGNKGDADWDDHYAGSNLAVTSRGAESPLRIAERNRAHFEQLEVGMTEDQVQDILGRETWRTSSRSRITNPHRTESFGLANGTRVVVLFYYTDTMTSDGLVREDELSPVWFEDGLLAGWGRAGFEHWSAQFAQR